MTDAELDKRIDELADGMVEMYKETVHNKSDMSLKLYFLKQVFERVKHKFLKGLKC